MILAAPIDSQTLFKSREELLCAKKGASFARRLFGRSSSIAGRGEGSGLLVQLLVQLHVQ